MAQSKRIDWSAQPLGAVSDEKIAASLGCSKTLVGYARKKLGVPPFQKHRDNCDPSLFRSELGTVADYVIAARFGISQGQVSAARRKLGIAPRRGRPGCAPLGRVADAEIAKQLGVTVSAVSNARQRREIAAWRATENRRCPCGGCFVAWHRRQRYCSFRCQRYRWQLVKRFGFSPEQADLHLALWRFKRAIKGKDRDVEQHA